MREHDVVVRAAVDIAATLCLPEGAASAVAAPPVPAILLIGGTGADTRDGDLEAAGTDAAPSPGTLRQIAHRLAHEGIASLRWDRRGFGRSGGERADNDYGSDVEDALACLRWARGRPEIDPARVAVAGHSAGALVVCLVCREAPGEVAAAGLLGALSTPIEDMLRANLGLITRRWDELTGEQQAWLVKERPAQLLRAEGLERLIEAAQRGDETVRLEGHGLTLDLPTRRLRQDIHTSYEAEMRHVRCPALVLHGGDDLNVDVDNALVTYRALRNAGNDRVDLVVLPGVEHYFCPVSADPRRRVWERLSLEALLRPMAGRALGAIAAWAGAVLGPTPTSVSGR